MAVGHMITSELVKELRERLVMARREVLATVATTDDELATLEAHQAGPARTATARSCSSAFVPSPPRATA